MSNPVRLVFLKEIFGNPYYARISENNRILYAMMVTVSNYLSDRPQLPDVSVPEESAEYASAKSICDQLSIDSGSVLTYICQYLKSAVSHLEKVRPGLLLVSRGESIASQYRSLCQKYAESNGIRIDAVDCRDSLQYNDILELIYNKAVYLGNDTGLVIIADAVPLTEIGDSIKEKTGIRCRIVSPLSYETIVLCIDELCKTGSFESLDLNIRPYTDGKHKTDTEDDFIDRLTDDVLSKTLTHINPKKAIGALMVSLDEITNELKIVKSREIIVKYLSHGVHMLERVIKRQPLDFYQLNRFSAENHNLMDIIAKSLAYAENTFDLSVPSCEIAYLAEIFLEGVE